MNAKELTQDILNQILADCGMNSRVESSFREITRDAQGRQILSGPLVDTVEAAVGTFFGAYPNLNNEWAIELIAIGEREERTELYGSLPEFNALDQALDAFYESLE